MSETKSEVQLILAKKPSELKEKDFGIIKEKFLKLSDEETFMKEVSFAIQNIKKSKALQKCSAVSVMESVTNLAQTGLTLNPVLKLAYMIPRWSFGAMQCCIDPSYQGMVKLVTDTGSAKSIYAHIVYKGDEFEVSLGTNTEITHKPKFESDEFDKVYAVAILHDGSKQVEIMTDRMVDEIRNTSESFKAYKEGKIPTCIWVEHYFEMAKKTVIKRLVKYLPKTDLWEKLGKAIEIENDDFKASDNQIDYIDSLLLKAIIPEEEKEAIEKEYSTMTGSRASQLIEHLKNNQVDPTHDNIASMGQITDKMKGHV